MSFNPDPNKQATEILFSQKRSKVDHPDLFFNGSVVNRVTEHKHLGLVLTPKLNFENHLVTKMKKAKKIIWNHETFKQVSAFKISGSYV